MENINISLGIELDKKQFNDNYIQSEVDKASSDITVKVNNVKIGDVSREIQNDIDKQVGNIEVKIENTSIDKSKINNIIEDFINNVNNELSRSGHILIGEDGVSLDNKALQNKLSKSIRASIQNAVESTEIDYGKISAVGSKKLAEQINQELSKVNVDELKSELSSIKSEIKVEDGSLESAKESLRELSAEVKSLELELSDLSILDDRDLAFVGDVLDEYSKRLDDIKYKKYELEDSNIGLIDTKELANFDVYYASVADKLDAMIEKANTFSNKVSDLDANQKLEVDVIPNVKNFDIQDEKVDITPNIKDFNIEDRNVDVNASVKELNVDVVPTIKTPDLEDKLDIKISNVDIPDRDVIYEKLQGILDSVSRELTVYVKNVDYNGDLSNFKEIINESLNSIDNLINIPFTLDFQEDSVGNIRNSIENLVTGVQGILDKSKQTFRMSAEYLEEVFGDSIKRVSEQLSKMLSREIVFDFENIRFEGLESKVSEISSKLSDGIVITPEVKIPETNTYNIKDNISSNRPNISNEEINVAITPELDLEIFEQQISYLKEFATKYGIEFSDEFMREIIDGIKSGDISSALQNIENQVKETVSDLYTDESKNAGSKLLANLNDYIREFKALLGGSKINIADILLSDEEVSDLKAKLGRVFTLSENDGKQLGRSISELKNLSDSFGFEFDERILQNAIKQLADIVDLRRQLKNDPISIPIEYVNIGFSENQHLQELDRDLSLIQSDLIAIENLARNLGEKFKFDIEVNPVKDLIDENSVNSSINSSKELQARLNEIKETATEVSNIKYKFDENGDLLRALITYKDEIGRTINELAGYELNPFTGELDFQTKLVSASEKFVDVTNEVKRLSKELDKLQGRAFLDESVITDVRNQIDSINGDNARESIDRLYGEIKRLGSAESEINKIVNSIKSVEDEVSKIYNNNISLFKDEDIQSDLDLLNDIIARLRSFKSDLESGSNVELLDVKSSIQELNIARDILKDTVVSQNKLNQLTEKQNELRRRLGSLAGLIDSSEIDRISKAIDDIRVDNLNSDFKAINNTIKSFSKSETQLTRVSKAINDIQNKMSNLNSDNIRLFESGNFDSEISKVVDSLENLISIRERLEAGESINRNNITSEINYLNNAYKNLNSTIETVISNESKVNDLQARLSKSIQTRITLDADTTYVNELVNSLNDIDITSEDASLQIAELSNQITSLGKTDAHILKVQDTISKLNNELNKFETINGIGKIVDDSDMNRVSSMESELEKLSSVLRKIENGANYTREEIQRMCNDGINSMRDLSDSAVDVGDVFSGLGGALNRGMEVALGFEFVELFRDQVSQMKDEIINLDNEMVSLKRVSSETEATYESIAKSANTTGVEMGKTTQEVVFATTEFVKMGYSIDEATNSLSKAGLTLSNVAEMDISASVDAIVSTMKGMRLSAEEAGTIVDIINEAGNSFALSSSDLAEGLRIGAASLSIAGNDLIEASSLITAGTEVLQSPEKVANGLKTISLRLRGVAEEGEELNPALGEMVKTLTDVDLTDANGEFRSTYDIIREIAGVWDQLGTKEQTLLLEEIAGKTQANVLAAVIQNVETLTDAYDVLGNSAGSAAAEQEAYMDSIAGKANALQENIRGIFYDLIDTNAVKDSLDIINGLIEGFRNFTGVFGSLPTIIGVGTLAFTAFNSKGREVASMIGDMLPGYNSLINNMNKFTVKLNEKIKKQQDDIESTKKLITANKQTGDSFAMASAKLAGYNAKLIATKVSMVAVKTAATLMNAALTAGLSLLVSWGINALIDFADGLIRTKEELKELNEEFNSAFSDEANISQLTEEYRGLAEQLRRTSEGTEEYSRITNRLTAIEKDLISLYPELKDAINQDTDAKWENVESIEALTKASLESAKAQARVVLGKNKVSGIDDIQEAIKAYEELHKKRKEYSDAFDRGQSTVATVRHSNGGVLWTKSTEKALDSVNNKIKDSETQLKAYYNAIKTLGSDGYGKFGGSLSLLEEALGITDVEVDNLSDSVGELGQEFSDAAVGVDKLSESFGSMTQPIKMLRDMISEFQEYGGLTDDTYLDVLESGNSSLIALLADSENFLSNAETLLGQLETAQSDAAKNLIEAAAAEQGMFQGVIDGANEASQAVTESAEIQANAISKTNEMSTEELGGQYQTLVNSVLEALNVTGTAAQEIEMAILDSVRRYVEAGNQLYAQDVDNSLSAVKAKESASEMWLNEEIQKLASTIVQFKDQYDADLVNWANDVMNKQAINKTYTDDVLSQIANMLTLNASNYSADTVNWASALSNKSANNVKMVNNIIQNIAQMILSNAKNYNADTVNWAKAITNKSNNNAGLCNNITSSMANVVNNLAVQYGTDAENFSKSITSKMKNLDDFVRKANAANSDIDAITGADVNVNNNKVPTSSGWYSSTSSSYVPGKVSGVTTSGGNYVGSVGNPDKESGKGSSGKDVADLEDLSDRYFDVSNALQKVENQIAAVETELESATGKDRIALLEKEIKLLNDKRNALINVRNEQQKELAELKNILANQGFNFASDGQISNYTAVVDRLVANANKLTGEAKEKAIANVKEIVEQLNRYTDLLLKDIPDISNQINGITGSVSDLRDEIEQIIEDTTLFSKDFIDRYYELNNVLKQVENELNSISVAIKNADDNSLVELLDKQIELYIKQGEALAAIRQENIKELNELGKELAAAGFEFKEDGTLSNYQEIIDKMVSNANKITDGKKQEKAVEQIEKLMETIEKYTDLLLNDIPEITDDMDDLANAVIDSQKEIADVLAKQKDEYIKNLKKETEALKEEVERRKSILEKQWEQEDAEDELAEKQKKLNELEDQLTVALRTGDEELIKNIREQIAEAQKDLNDFIRDQERDYISDRFDEDLDKIDEDLENKLEEIEEKLSDEELLNLVQSGVRDLTEVLNKIENGGSSVRKVFSAIGTTISETWMDALDSFVDKLESISDLNIGINLESKLDEVKNGFNKVINITQGNLIVEGNITEDILPTVQSMIDVANNNLINNINEAFFR